MALLALLLLSARPGQPLLTNGDFEAGLTGWGLSNNWYAQPKDAGLSPITVAPGEGRDGGQALKIVGEGKRAIAMQVFAGYAGKYKVTGWVKCENLEAGDAKLLVEWIGPENKYLGGSGTDHVKGTTDWTYLAAEIDAPDEARMVHFDLLTSAPNHGTVWFDDLTFERLPLNLPPPNPPVLQAATPAGEEGCLELTWDPAQLGKGVVRLLAYVDHDHPVGVPIAVVDAAEGQATIQSLTVGTEYHCSAVTVNADGVRSIAGPVVEATVADRQAPRPGWVAAERVGANQVEVTWSPHVLDADLAALEIASPMAPPRTIRKVDLQPLLAEARPLHCTEPWGRWMLDLPAGQKQLGVRCTDQAGNAGEFAWVAVSAARPSTPLTDRPYWWASPVQQVQREATPPADPPAAPTLTCRRGESEGTQLMLRPAADLQRVRVTFDDAKSDLGATLPARWLAWHFVDYVTIEKNSRATPKEELLWPGPADYPDELSDDVERDLPADQVQPLFFRVTAPTDAKPGTYQVTGRVESDQGRLPFTFAVTIPDVPPAPRPWLQFVYWFSWGDACKQFGVDSKSADGWRVLRRLGELMTAYHQNVVTVPIPMARAWADDQGHLKFDYRDFDRFIDTMSAAGVDRLFALSHIGSRTTGEWTCPTMGAHRFPVRDLADGEERRISALDYLPALQAHLESRGLLEQCALHIADEPIPQNVESYRELSAQAHERAPKLRRIDAMHVPDLRGALEIWVPQLNYFNQWEEGFHQAQADGNEVWFYIAWVPQGKFPNRMIDSAAIKSRVLHWFNYLGGTTGYLHWALNHWHIPLSSLQSPGDQYIVWPSQRFIANSSLRYEAELSGLQDCELMFELQRKLVAGGMTEPDARKKLAGVASTVVRGVEDYTRSWDELEQVRLRLLAGLAQE